MGLGTGHAKGNACKRDVRGGGQVRKRYSEAWTRKARRPEETRVCIVMTREEANMLKVNTAAPYALRDVIEALQEATSLAYRLYGPQ